ncbi:CD276 antigen-like [Acipenser oxyrinchus oxyrinchus]|uniref:CD276 antigen-like n=2 Tax=Acipenser oxyrinchus oxyrinchus TaxID=40147 RepID=A0AAD8FXH6_ACIOX|nr:CD276 antigen-like [Acipenser oxyrinchus oxyrinchus]
MLLYISCGMAVILKRLLFLSVFTTDAFEVKAPRKHNIAVYGEPAFLECSYPTSGDSPLNQLVVTWQREGREVVHSFYYGSDQPDTQSQRYRNRTSLYLSQLLKGNASLRLDRVGPQDAGEYLCSVSNLEGTGKDVLHLAFAAYYKEPRFSAKLHSGNTSLLYESEGYPEAQVQWLTPQGRDLPHRTEALQQTNGSGLYTLKSLLVVDLNSDTDFTFILQNDVLNQTITRFVSFSRDGDGDSENNCDCLGKRLAIVLIVITALLLSVAGLLCYQRRKRPDMGGTGTL